MKLKWQKMDFGFQNEKFQITISRAGKPRGAPHKAWGIIAQYYHVDLYLRSGQRIRGETLAKSYVSSFVTRLKDNAQSIEDGYKFWKGQVVAENRGRYERDYGFIVGMRTDESGARLYKVAFFLREHPWHADVELSEGNIHITTIPRRSY